MSVIKGFWTLLFSLCVSPLLWIDWVGFTWVWRSNSHPCLLAHLRSSLRHCDHWLLLLSPPFLVSSHVSTLCSFLHFGPMPLLCLPTFLPLALLIFLHCTFLPHPSAPAPLLFYVLSLLSWSHTITASPSLFPRLLGISLLALFTQPTHFMGLIPFLTVCLQVWGQVLICLSLFLPSLASSLSLAALSLTPYSPTDGSSHSLLTPFYSSTWLSLSLSSHRPFSFFLNLCITLYCVSFSCYLVFSSTTPLHPFDSSSPSLRLYSFFLTLLPQRFLCIALLAQSLLPPHLIHLACQATLLWLTTPSFNQFLCLHVCVSVWRKLLFQNRIKWRLVDCLKCEKNWGDENRVAEQKHMNSRRRT